MHPKNRPATFNDVGVWAADPWHPASKAQIRGLDVRTCAPGQKLTPVQPSPSRPNPVQPAPGTRSGVRISSIFSVLPPLYFDLFTSTSVLRPFVKYGLLIGREVQAEVQLWSK